MDVLILMSTYNGAQYLLEQLDSIIAQSNIKFRLLIRDDKSTDNGQTIRILKQYAKQFPSLITLIEGDENLGYAQSFSKLIHIGLNEYPGIKYLAFSDQDDVWNKDKLYEGLRKLKSIEDSVNKVPTLYCSNTELVDKKLSHIRYSWNQSEVQITKERALIQSFATGCTFIFNREAAILYDTHYNPRYPSAHDYFMYQSCVFFGKVIWDYNAYIKYRQHGNNMIGRPNFYNRMSRRFKRLFKSSHDLENQNLEFYNIYKELLSDKDKRTFEFLINYRKRLLNRIKLMFDSKIKYTNVENNIILIFKILIGRV